MSDSRAEYSVSSSEADGNRPTGGDASRAVTWRSVLLGLSGVLFICVLTPYNDYVMASTFLVGNSLPIGLLLFFSIVVMLINAPLWAWAPRMAIRSGELAVAMGMTMVACALPGSGLMRYLPATMTGIHAGAQYNEDYLRMLQKDVRPPDWVFPSFQSSDAGERSNENVIRYYMTRTPTESWSFRERVAAVPWRLWRTPAIAWGLLLAAVYGAVLCLSLIVRRQWVENERLPFPLATVYLSLIEEPQRGRAVNALFRDRRFWMAFSMVFGIHFLNSLSQYAPRYVPRIPLSYDLWPVFANPPWHYVSWFFKSPRIYFSVIGVTYFLQTKVAFSLWAFIAILQIVNLAYGAYEMAPTDGEQTDQLFGSLMAFGLMILWIGRHHWRLVIVQMFRGRRDGEPRARYLPYRFLGWALIVCLAGIVLWLQAAGASFLAAVVVVAMMMLLFLVAARIVAETGLLFVQIIAPVQRLWVFSAQDLPGGMHVTPRSFFLTTWFNYLFVHDQRETLSVYATHAVRIADQAAYARQPNWRRAAPFAGCLVMALAVGYLAAGASTLYVEYNHANTLEANPESPINPYGVQFIPQDRILPETQQYLLPSSGPLESHSRPGHFFFGAALTGLLAFLRLRFAAWPLHPIGFLLLYSYPMAMMWTSIFFGWLLKSLILKFGGAKLFSSARAFFIGLIVGEAGAAAFWLIVSLVRNAMGLTYFRINLLPI